MVVHARRAAREDSAGRDESNERTTHAGSALSRTTDEPAGTDPRRAGRPAVDRAEKWVLGSCRRRFIARQRNASPIRRPSNPNVAVAEESIAKKPVETAGPADKTRAMPMLLSLAALGVVFGDIGTSPLYTLPVCFQFSGAAPTAGNVLGICSLILWTLVLVVCVKYVTFIMRVDHRGRGRNPRPARAGGPAQGARTDRRRGAHDVRDRRRCDALRRRDDHAGDLGHLGGRGARRRDARRAAVRGPAVGGHPAGTVRGAGARHGERRPAVRPGDAAVVRRDRRRGRASDRRAARRSCRRSIRATR